MSCKSNLRPNRTELSGWPDGTADPSVSKNRRRLLAARCGAHVRGIHSQVVAQKRQSVAAAYRRRLLRATKQTDRVSQVLLARRLSHRARARHQRQ